MSEELQPGQLVMVNDETCKVLAATTKRMLLFAYSVETPNDGIKTVAACEIQQVISEAPETVESDEDKAQREVDEATAAAEKEDAELAVKESADAQALADEAAADALTKAHDLGEHGDVVVEHCPYCQKGNSG